MRALSLFSGCGGADLGLHAAGIETVAFAEIERHAAAVLQHHWPDVPNLGDVTTITRETLAPLGRIDVVVGGSPCQDLSVAGKRAGMTEGSGTRSSLYYEQVRIWHEADAPYMIWENVPGALSSNNGADFAAVLSALVGAAVPVPRDGWRGAGVAAGNTGVAAWRLLDLQYFGVPQRRRRLVVLAARAGGVDPAEVLAVGQGVRGDTAPRFASREDAAAVAGGRAASSRGPVAGTLDTKSANRGDDFGGMTFTVAPTVTSNATGGGRGHSLDSSPGGLVVAHTLRAEGHDASEDGTGRGTPLVVSPTDRPTDISGPLTARYHKGANTTADDGAIVVARRRLR